MTISIEIEKEIKSKLNGATSTAERVARLFSWICNEFQWIETDYVDRSFEEIMQRKAGNCAEQAKVVETLLSYIGIKTRWVLEINAQPDYIERQQFAEQLVAEQGNFYSIFGLNHNDHRWIEYYDADQRDWCPLDTSFAILGIESFMEKRLSFHHQSIPSTEGIIPFCLFALDANHQPLEERSSDYLIKKFLCSFRKNSSSTVLLEEWEALISELTSLGVKTYKQEVNFHLHQDRVKRFVQVYEEIKQLQVAQKVETIQK